MRRDDAVCEKCRMPGGRKRLFPTEVGRDFTHGGSVPLVDRNPEGVGAEPVFGTCDELVERFGVWCTFERSLRLLVAYPCLCREGIAVDVHNIPLGFEQCQGMDYGQELTDVVGTMDRTKVKHHTVGGMAVVKEDTSVLHRTGIAGAGGIDGKGVMGIFFHRNRKIRDEMVEFSENEW